MAPDAHDVSSARGEPETQLGDFQHWALFYRGIDGFIEGTLPFVVDGVNVGEPVLVAAPPDRLEALADALGDIDDEETDDVRFLNMTDAGRNPGRILSTVLLPFSREHPGQRVRIVGEPIWAQRTALEYPACVEHEALINTAFAGRDATILCPYDESTLRTAVIDDARTTHPHLLESREVMPCQEYAEPDLVVAARNRPLADPPVYAVTLTVTVGDLPGVRQFAADRARTAGLPAHRAEEAAEAIHELTLARLLLSKSTSLGAWAENGSFVCQVGDGGPASDRRAEWAPAHEGHPRGMLRVHQLADLVRVSTAPNRSTVRIYFG